MGGKLPGWVTDEPLVGLKPRPRACWLRAAQVTDEPLVGLKRVPDSGGEQGRVGYRRTPCGIEAMPTQNVDAEASLLQTNPLWD